MFHLCCTFTIRYKHYLYLTYQIIAKTFVLVAKLQGYGVMTARFEGTAVRNARKVTESTM